MSFLKDYFTYSRKERSGIIALFILMLLSIFSYFVIDYINFSQPAYDYSEYKNEIDEFEKGQIALEKSTDNSRKKTYSSYKNKTNYFNFNPNSISYDSLILLGIYPKVSQRIIKYREAGGVFKSPKDLLKVYGFSEKLYVKLENYIQISQNSLNEPMAKVEKSPIEKTIININTADTTQLKSLNGIGSKLSNRIIQYRNKLGGFHSVNQLLEVYGLKEETFNSIQNKIEIDQAIIKIKINSATAAEIKVHPYIKTWNQANAIVSYREKHGKYKAADDLLKTDLVDEDLVRKIAPYLDFE